MGAPDFSKLNTLMHKLIFVKNGFYPSTIRKWQWRHQNEGGGDELNGTNNSINIKKYWDIVIEEFLNCAPMCLCFILIKMKEFCVTQNDTPKTGKKYVSTNKFSHVFKEHKPSILDHSRINVPKYVSSLALFFALAHYFQYLSMPLTCSHNRWP